MSMLSGSGYQVRCGVLSEQDSDYQVARRLGFDVISEPPFSRITLAHQEELLDQVKKADLVIVTSMPIGWGNFPNLKVLEEISAEMIILYIPESELIIQDFTGGAATSLLNILIEKGVIKAQSIAEVLELVEKSDQSKSQKFMD
jgi:iron complex transport system ATP-binding protein